MTDYPEHTIEAMTESHLDAVFYIEQSGYDFPWPRNIFEKVLDVGMPALVLLVDNAVIGYCVLMFETEECHILNVCVHHQHCGQGWGKCILEHVIELAGDEGADEVLLEVRENNVSAQQLYLNYGFKEVGRRKDYYPDHQGHEDALVFKLDLIHGESH